MQSTTRCGSGSSEQYHQLGSSCVPTVVGTTYACARQSTSHMHRLQVCVAPGDGGIVKPYAPGCHVSLEGAPMPPHGATHGSGTLYSPSIGVYT